MLPLNIADFTNKLTPFELPGPAGRLECVLERPSIAPKPYLAIICHPHPQHQGTMNNKVVTTLARSLQKMGVWTLRFNYRGVGSSQGSYGEIEGEVADAMAVIAYAQQQFAEHQLVLAGFSFGAYVAAKAATLVQPLQLIAVAPSVENMPYDQLPPITAPWLVIQGDEDEIVSPQAVFTWAKTVQPPVNLIKMHGVTHFFHGKLTDISVVLQQALASQFV